MDITRFETLLRSPSPAGTRRRALAVLLSWVTPTLRLTEAEASKSGTAATISASRQKQKITPQPMIRIGSGRPEAPT